MQDELDESSRQVKKLANFDPVTEKLFKRMSVYEFMDHLLAVHDSNQE